MATTEARKIKTRAICLSKKDWNEKEKTIADWYKLTKSEQKKRMYQFTKIAKNERYKKGGIDIKKERGKRKKLNTELRGVTSPSYVVTAISKEILSA